jgi:PAS domain S-box-containing protein
MESKTEPVNEKQAVPKPLEEEQVMRRDLQYREAVLRTSHEERTAILSSLLEGVTYLDANMRVLWTNRTGIDTACLPQEQIKGRYCYHVWCQAGEPRPGCPAMRSIRTGQREEGEISMVDGRILLHRSYPTRDEEGNMLGIVVITLDITRRKQSEELLRRSENAYHTLADNLPGIVYRVFLREHNRMEFFNNMLETLTGYGADKLSAGEVCSIEPLIIGEDRDAMVTVVKRAIQSHQPFQVEYRLKKKEGAIRYFSERGKPIYGADGEPLYIDGIIFDVTKRKQAEEALLFKENIIKHSSSVIATCDLGGNMTYGNPSFLTTWGFSNPEEFLGRPFWEFWLVEHRLNEIMQALRGGGAWFDEIKARRKDGSIFDVQVSAAMVFDSGGTPIALTSTSTVITERKRMEEELRRSRDELENRVNERTEMLSAANQGLRKATEVMEKLFSTTNIIFAYLDRHFNFLRVNRAMSDDDGRAPDFFVGKNLFDLFPNVDEKDFMKVVETGEPYFGWDKSFVHPEHPERGVTYWDWGLQAVKEQNGQVSGVVLSCVNVTERVRAEGALRASERRLRLLSSKLITAQEQERKRVASELHDSIAGSLSGIKFSIENALSKMEKGAVAAELLASLIPQIQGGIEETRRIMADLRPPMLDSLGVSAAVHWLCREFEKTYSPLVIENRIDLEEDVVADALKTAMFRVSQEALNNTARHSKAQLVEFSLRQIGNRMELTVQDNGRGFDPESSAGGLGLISMKERVELSGGTFSITSVPGEGTTIRAAWPCRKSKKKRSAKTSSHAASPGVEPGG